LLTAAKVIEEEQEPDPQLAPAAAEAA